MEKDHSRCLQYNQPAKVNRKPQLNGTVSGPESGTNETSVESADGLSCSTSLQTLLTSLAPATVAASSETAANGFQAIAGTSQEVQTMAETLLLSDMFDNFQFQERAPLGTTEMSLRSSIPDLNMYPSRHFPIPTDREHEFNEMGGFAIMDSNSYQYPTSMEEEPDYEFVCVCFCGNDSPR
jgi:hypothetical protein